MFPIKYWINPVNELFFDKTAGNTAESIEFFHLFIRTGVDGLLFSLGDYSF